MKARLRKKAVKVCVIPDVHGRSDWDVLKDPTYLEQFDKVIFLGDYLDSRDRTMTPEMQLENFRNILQFAEDHANKVILLLGNHDLMYAYSYTGTDSTLGEVVRPNTGHLYAESRMIAAVFQQHMGKFRWFHKIHDVMFVHGGFNHATWEVVKRYRKGKTAINVGYLMSMEFWLQLQFPIDPPRVPTEDWSQIFAVSRVSGGYDAWDGVFWERHPHEFQLPFQQVVGHSRTHTEFPVRRRDVLFCDCWTDPSAYVDPGETCYEGWRRNHPIELVINGSIQQVNGVDVS